MPSRPLLLATTVLALAACSPGGAMDEVVEEEINASVSREAIAGPVIDLSVEQLRSRLDSGAVRLIDVRRDDEVAQGMIAGAEHIALDEFNPAALDLSDGREIVLYCRSGRRSAIAAERLADHTGRPAAHLEGGILAWEAPSEDGR